MSAIVETVIQDIRYALRSFRRTKSFTVAVLLALTLGIGSTTAVFSVVDRILFRRLPYPADERLVSIGMMAPLDTNEFVLSADWFDWRAANTPFESMTTISAGGDVCDLDADPPERLQCWPVEATFLTTFGVRPIVGRDFTAAEDQSNGARVGIISYDLWNRRYSRAPDVIGRTISLSGASVIIVGVLPADFEMPNLSRADLLVPQALPFVAHPNSGRPLRAFARLKPGVTIAQAQAAMQPIFENSLQWVPPAFRSEVTLRVRSMRDRQIHEVGSASWILFGSVLAVLLIACANVSNLLLARAAARQREFAVRFAIGAKRGRLIRQALTESVVLGLMGSALGCGFAGIIIRIIVALAPTGIPRLAQATLDLRTLFFALVSAFAAALTFGVLPALQRPVVGNLVHRSHVGSPRFIRQALVAGQVAVSLILLTSAVMLIRTLWNLQNIPLGIATRNVIVAPVLLGRQHYPGPRQQRAFFEGVEGKLRSVPGLGVVAITDSAPLGGVVSDVTGQGGTHSTLYAGLHVEGRPENPQGTGGLVAWRAVTPDYFAALGIRILRGRSFTEDDRRPGSRAIILSASLEGRLFGNTDAVGKRIQTAPNSPYRTIVGIAADAKNNPGLGDADDPEDYVPRMHDDAEGVSPNAAIIVRTSASVDSAAKVIRAAIAEMDPTVPVSTYTMEQRLGELVARPRFNAVLTTGFALAGTLLAAIGLYGVLSFIVVQRNQEVGVRLALGATSQDIVRLILSGAMRWTALGVALGLIGSFFATRVLRSLLFKVEARDLWILALTVSLMFAIAMLAAGLPAWRASRTDAMVALKHE